MGRALGVLLVAGTATAAVAVGATPASAAGGILTGNVLTVDHTRVVRNAPDNCVC